MRITGGSGSRRTGPIAERSAHRGADFPAVETLGNAVIAATRDRQGTFAGKSATVWRDEVESADYLPATRAHRRLVGVKVRWR